MRDGPVVLIGAFNNDWSMRLMGPRRFSFERSGNTFWIKDHQNPSDQSHAVNYATPYLTLTEDFALISRVLDPVTERMVVLAGGLTGYGTMAAGEFLSNPAYMETIAAPGAAKLGPQERPDCDLNQGDQRPVRTSQGCHRPLLVVVFSARARARAGL